MGRQDQQGRLGRQDLQEQRGRLGMSDLQELLAEMVFQVPLELLEPQGQKEIKDRKVPQAQVEM